MHDIRNDETERNTQIKRAESDKTYDIYLLRGCQRPPDFGDLVQETPMLADPARLSRIFPYYKRYPGFLGLDLSYARAAKVLQALKAAKADGYRIDAIYRREPNISAEQAAAIVEHALAELRVKGPNSLSDPLELRGEIPVCCWAFWAEIEEGSSTVIAFRQPGILYPGVLHVYVDKQDGHVWQPEEFERLYNDGTERKTGISWVESQRTYDIQFSGRCRTQPDFGDLVQEVPMLTDPALLARILPREDLPRKYEDRSRYLDCLGLDLSYSLAGKVLRALKATKAFSVYRVEAIYRREPNITVEHAAPIAERAFVEVKAERPNVLFKPLEFWPADNLCCWVFHATVPGQCGEGGGLFIHIDKQDGHVWQMVEFDRLQEKEFLIFPSGCICDTKEFEKLPRKEQNAIRRGSALRRAERDRKLTRN